MHRLAEDQRNRVLPKALKDVLKMSMKDILTG